MKYTVYKYTVWCTVYLVVFSFMLPIAIFQKVAWFSDLNAVAFFSFFIGFAIPGYFFAKYFGLRRLDIWIENNNLFIKNYKINSNIPKKTISAKIEDIVNFDDSAFGGNLKFEVTFSNGYIYRISRLNSCHRKDDMERLISDFKEYIEKHNKNLNSKDVTTGKRFIKYGGKSDLILAIVSWLASFLFIILFVDSLFDKKAKFILIFGIVIFFATGITAYMRDQDIKKHNRH